MSLQTRNPKDINFALSYPFYRPTKDFLYINGQSYEILERQGTCLQNWIIRVGALTLPVSELWDFAGATSDDLTDFIPIVAAGSNASPMQLSRKFSGMPDTVIPCLKTTLSNWGMMYARGIAYYGSIPASLEPLKGATTEVFVNFLSPEAFEHMNKTEHVGEHYNVIEVTGFDQGFILDLNRVKTMGYTIIGPHFDVQVMGLEAQNVDIPALSQWEIQERAIQILGENLSVERFIWENITDSELSRTRSQRLKDLV